MLFPSSFFPPTSDSECVAEHEQKTPPYQTCDNVMDVTIPKAIFVACVVAISSFHVCVFFSLFISCLHHHPWVTRICKRKNELLSLSKNTYCKLLLKVFVFRTFYLDEVNIYYVDRFFFLIAPVLFAPLWYTNVLQLFFRKLMP